MEMLSLKAKDGITILRNNFVFLHSCANSIHLTLLPHKGVENTIMNMQSTNYDYALCRAPL